MARHALAELGSQGFVALATVHKFGPLRIGDVAERLREDFRHTVAPPKEAAV
jgi:hypothetical protein